MTWTLSQSGTTATLNVASGETTLGSADTNNATFTLTIDLSNMVLGDLVELRIKTIDLNGGSTIQCWKGTYQHVQINNIKISPPIASDQSLTCTIKWLALASGTRSNAWKILRI